MEVAPMKERSANTDQVKRDERNRAQKELEAERAEAREAQRAAERTPEPGKGEAVSRTA